MTNTDHSDIYVAAIYTASQTNFDFILTNWERPRGMHIVDTLWGDLHTLHFDGASRHKSVLYAKDNFQILPEQNSQLMSKSIKITLDFGPASLSCNFQCFLGSKKEDIFPWDQHFLGSQFYMLKPICGSTLKELKPDQLSV